MIYYHFLKDKETFEWWGNVEDLSPGDRLWAKRAGSMGQSGKRGLEELFWRTSRLGGTTHQPGYHRGAGPKRGHTGRPDDADQ